MKVRKNGGRGRCGKVTLTSWKKAAGLAGRLDGGAHPYWCPVCGGYHVSSADRRTYDQVRGRYAPRKEEPVENNKLYIRPGQPTVVVRNSTQPVILGEVIVATFADAGEAEGTVGLVNAAVAIAPVMEKVKEIITHWEDLAPEERASGGMTATLRDLLDGLAELNAKGLGL